ncbi:hypothetical protein MMC24_002487 [Lignoscripta atroalba]|nr:hypothetical protein [Lignoscripta atroalba]
MDLDLRSMECFESAPTSPSLPQSRSQWFPAPTLTDSEFLVDANPCAFQGDSKAPFPWQVQPTSAHLATIGTMREILPGHDTLTAESHRPFASSMACPSGSCDSFIDAKVRNDIYNEGSPIINVKCLDCVDFGDGTNDEAPVDRCGGRPELLFDYGTKPHQGRLEIRVESPRAEPEVDSQASSISWYISETTQVRDRPAARLQSHRLVCPKEKYPELFDGRSLHYLPKADWDTEWLQTAGRGRGAYGAPGPQRNAKDEFLIRSKLSGMSYKDIKARGNFKEAESTLRGRFRTLTKRKEHRVRKPQWHETDVRYQKTKLLKQFAGQSDEHVDPAPSAGGPRNCPEVGAHSIARMAEGKTRVDGLCQNPMEASCGICSTAWYLSFWQRNL